MDPKSSTPTFEQIAEARYSRRDLLFMAGKIGALAVASTAFPPIIRQALAQTEGNPQIVSPVSSSLTFAEIPKSYFTIASVSPGYSMKLVLRWGDPILPGAPVFDPLKQSKAAQEKQFGYNCDFTAFLPYPPAPENSNRGLLFVNHEYTVARLMFPGNQLGDEEGGHSKDEVEIEMAAQGCSIVEVESSQNTWSHVMGSPYNRRVTATTPIAISGPAAGHARLRTKADPTGKKVLGTFGNCAGGVTPWNTILTCEENIDGYFHGEQFTDAEKRNHTRMGIGKHKFYSWHDYDDRFNAEKEPNEPNRFGWVVEIDPYDPDAVPIKRTALGRFKHESATVTLSPDKQVVVYCGDDEKFEYLYRFVSTKRYNPKDRDANKDLLDDGVLSVAQFQENGNVEWHKLVYGAWPLNEKNGFHSQADVLIEARAAAQLMGATPMDRPEDIDVSPVTGKVYVVMTKNADRKEVDPANPRPHNVHGHIIELTPPDKNHAAETYRWTMFLEGGDPAKPEDQAMYLGAVSEHGWLSCPDNVTFDPRGRLWIATDGQPVSIGKSDGLYATDTEGSMRGATRQFFTGPKGAEISGPSFTPDGKALFVSVMHPSEEPGVRYDNPSTRWPDFKADMPPRPAVIVITKDDGGEIGG